jgi:hypothetical protein
LTKNLPNNFHNGENSWRLYELEDKSTVTADCELTKKTSKNLREMMEEFDPTATTVNLNADERW